MRPEAGGNAWDAYGSDIPEDFEPYRVGDAGSLDQPGGVPIEQARGYSDGRRLLDELPDRIGRPDPAADAGQAEQPPRERFRWSEDSRKLEAGDRVRATRGMGNGGVFNAVHGRGERGEITNVRHSVFGGRRGDVTFENGSTVRDVELDGDHGLERRGWLD